MFRTRVSLDSYSVFRSETTAGVLREVKDLEGELNDMYVCLYMLLGITGDLKIERRFESGSYHVRANNADLRNQQIKDAFEMLPFVFKDQQTHIMLPISDHDVMQFKTKIPSSELSKIDHFA